jgi:ribosomal protein S27E
VTYRPVTAHTRARRDGSIIKCPCGHRLTVYHFAWSALVCPHCTEAVEKLDWRVQA